MVAALALVALLAVRGAAAGDGGRRLQEPNGTNVSQPSTPDVYPDVTDVECELGGNCTGAVPGSVPPSRGLCVQGPAGGTGNSCWDVCNPAHQPNKYIIDSSDEGKIRNKGYEALVEQVRAGLNPFVQCPGELHQGDSCPPGDPCGDLMAQEFGVPEGQGLCVMDASQPQSRACWDMCDGSRRPDEFEEGTPEGAARKVEEARAGATCSHMWPWWAWVVLFLVLLCCSGVLCVASGMIRTKRVKGDAAAARGLDYEQGDDSRREQLAYDPEGYGQQKQMAYEEQYGPGAPESAGGSRPRDLLDEGYGPTAGDGHPPEPQRPATYSEAPPPEPSPFPDERGGRPQPVMSGSTRAIPGLDEPMLFPSVQPLVMPTATAQVAPPELLGLTSQLAPPGSQLNMLGSQRAVPTYGVGGPAAFPHASSVQLAPGGTPFFSQLAGTGH